MHAKRMDKIATGVLYAISGIIVAILASLILLYLGPWLAPCILAFLDWEIFFLPSRRRDRNSIV